MVLNCESSRLLSFNPAEEKDSRSTMLPLCQIKGAEYTYKMHFSDFSSENVLKTMLTLFFFFYNHASLYICLSHERLLSELKLNSSLTQVTAPCCTRINATMLCCIVHSSVLKYTSTPSDSAGSILLQSAHPSCRTPLAQRQGWASGSHGN